MYDAKTRLKELFDHHKNIGKIEYVVEKQDGIQQVKVYRVLNNKRIFMGNGYSTLKIDGEQKAATSAMKRLQQSGIVRNVPNIFGELKIIYPDYF